MRRFVTLVGSGLLILGTATFAAAQEQAPVQKEVQAPVQKEVQAPVQKEVQAPVQKEVQAPVQKSVQAPIQKPTQKLSVQKDCCQSPVQKGDGGRMARRGGRFGRYR
jgi:hypothetical protein